MQQILIYDDNRTHCEMLNDLLASLGEQDVDIAVTADEAAALIRKKNYSVLFLDIELDGGQNGIDFAGAFQKQFPDVSLVYITAHILYCEEIFTTAPTAFLLKPFTIGKLRRVMQIVSQKQNSTEYLMLHAGSRILRIPLGEIAYIESRRRHLVVFGTEGICIGEYYGIRISDIEGQLPSSFLHCHQSILVNMQQIASYSRYALTLRCGTEIPVSQSRAKAVKQRYLEFLGDVL